MRHLFALLFALLSTSAHGGEGSIGHALLHGFTGCAAAELQGEGCAAGAASGMGQAFLAGALEDAHGGTLTQQQRQAALNDAQMLGAFMGYLFSGGDAGNVSLGGSIAQSGMAHNYLSHTDLDDLERALEACFSSESCDDARILLEFQQRSAENDVQLALCYTQQCVDHHLSQVGSLDRLRAIRHRIPDGASVIMSLYSPPSGASYLTPHDAVLDQVALNIEHADRFINRCTDQDPACIQRISQDLYGDETFRNLLAELPVTGQIIALQDCIAGEGCVDAAINAVGGVGDAFRAGQSIVVTIGGRRVDAVVDAIRSDGRVEITTADGSRTLINPPPVSVGGNATNTAGNLFDNPSQVVGSRIDELTAQIPENSRGRITMGVAVVEDAAGNRQILVSTSEPNGYLRPGVNLNDGEVLVRGPRGSHAEADIVRYAEENGLTVVDIGATRPVCANCQSVIPDDTNITTPLK